MFSSVEHSSMKQYGLERGGGAETLSLGGEKRKGREVKRDGTRQGERSKEAEWERAYGHGVFTVILSGPDVIVVLHLVDPNVNLVCFPLFSAKEILLLHYLKRNPPFISSLSNQHVLQQCNSSVNITQRPGSFSKQLNRDGLRVWFMLTQTVFPPPQKAETNRGWEMGC